MFWIVYTTEDIQQIVKYALYRGIRVVPEFDVPGHAASWGKGKSSNVIALLQELIFVTAFPNATVDCPDYAANINNIPLDPTQQFTYTLLAGFLSDMNQVFPDSYLHLGGDEVVFGCWQENTAVTVYRSLTNLFLSSFTTIELDATARYFFHNRA